MAQKKLPAWVDLGLLPLINLTLAFLCAGVVVLMLGENPIAAVQLLVYGAFGYDAAIGYTLAYATTFVFAGLAVAIPFHCGLFNIGGEGQALLGGLGATLACLWLVAFLPAILAVPIAIMVAAAFGAFWGFVPGWLQAKRGSHTVITTIMLNFIAAALMTYLLVNVLIQPGQSNPESARYPDNTLMPQFHEMAGWFGLEMARSPLNLSAILALLVCFGVWFFLWRTRSGYELRVVGVNHRAAIYAGISPDRQTVLAMTIGGAMAGLMAVNILMGDQHRLLLNFSGGFGFVGIAVALMGRNHPFGVVLAAILFGALYQGGSELAFDMPSISRDMVVVIQGLVILFAGALEHMFRPRLAGIFAREAPAAQAS